MENSGFSQRSENFENVCVTVQKLIEYLNTVERYSGRIFIKFKRDEGSFEISLCLCSIRVFIKFSGDPYYEPLAWFMVSEQLQLKSEMQDMASRVIMW